MELAVGQFTRRGPIGALAQICPLFKGILINAIPARDTIVCFKVPKSHYFLSMYDILVK
jgi:hypothetical protein